MNLHLWADEVTCVLERILVIQMDLAALADSSVAHKMILEENLDIYFKILRKKSIN